MAAAAPSLHPLTSFRLFRPSSALPALQSSSSFFPPSTTHRSSPSRTPRLHSQLTPSSAAVVTEADPAAGEDGEKFDWFAQWYPVAPICDLDTRRPHAKTILGLDIVVWWDRVEGRWQVFDDRCPHRLAPLSEGRIDPGGRLQCVYHGWCFDGSGNCKYIPQAPDDGPQFHTFRKACASVYPSFEQNKILWFWPNTDPQYKSISVKKKPPYIQELDDPSYTTMEGIRDFPFGYEVLIENLMDPAHVPYAHRGIMNVPKSPNKRPDREGGLPLDIKLDTLDITGFSAHRNFGYNRFIAPCVFYSSSPPLISGNGSPSSSVVQEDSTLKSLQKQRRFLLIFMCIPVSPGRSRLIYTFPRNFAVWVNRVVPRWIIHVGQNLILDSDLYLLHVEERKFAKAGPSNWSKICFVPTKSDAMVVAFRNWLRKYSNSQINWGTAFNEQLLPPTPPREQLLDRYWTHVVHCSSCRSALKFLKALKLCLQIIAFASVGIVAAIKQSTISTITRSAVVSLAVLGFIASKWLSHFIYKNFYYHDYDHAFK